MKGYEANQIAHVFKWLTACLEGNIIVANLGLRHDLWSLRSQPLILLTPSTDSHSVCRKIEPNVLLVLASAVLASNYPVYSA